MCLLLFLSEFLSALCCFNLSKQSNLFPLGLSAFSQPFILASIRSLDVSVLILLETTMLRLESSVYRGGRAILLLKLRRWSLLVRWRLVCRSILETYFSKSGIYYSVSLVERDWSRRFCNAMFLNLAGTIPSVSNCLDFHG